MPKSIPAILQKVRRRLETFLGLGPRASDNLTGFLNGEDVRRLVAKPVGGEFFKFGLSAAFGGSPFLLQECQRDRLSRR
jgi:hypothetical protein